MKTPLTLVVLAVVLADQGFTNLTGAKVHVVLNDHGLRLSPYIPDMIRTYRGGCIDECPRCSPRAPSPTAVRGPNACRLYPTAALQQ